MEKYRQVSFEKFPESNRTATIYEKTVGSFTLVLDSHEGKNDHGVNFRINRGEELS